jgi:hypothetical protein
MWRLLMLGRFKRPDSGISFQQLLGPALSLHEMRQLSLTNRTLTARLTSTMFWHFISAIS